MARTSIFPAPISEHIWREKYCLQTSAGTPAEVNLDETFHRVVAAAAKAEAGGIRRRAKWERGFFDAIADFGFLPAGRILAGAGARRRVTLFNCFVMGRIDDDLSAIFDHVREAALTMQQGGGIGHDFSTLRPNGAPVASIGADASGPVSFMDVWDAMCRTIMSAGARRGAMMATLRCDHPDIEAFIDAKSDARRLRNFNLSVLVSDAFMAAVRDDRPWNLAFSGKTYKTLPARTLWDCIMRATYDYAEPGVVFIDRVNQRNNLAYCENIQATNPCGEQPLPPYGACLLGSINLAHFIDRPFAVDATMNVAAIEERVKTAVRFLDNIIDVSKYPLPEQRKEAKAKRRIGLGVTGLADALILLGIRYGSERASILAGQWMEAVQNAAYATSAALAADKGSFPLFNGKEMLSRPNVEALFPEVRKSIAKHGLRNGCLTSIAPTGTISLFAGNISSGIEPVFDFQFQRRVLDPSGSVREIAVEDFAHALYRRKFGNDAPLGDAFVRASDLTPRQHLEMQASVQRHVDSSISKTINCPIDIPFEAFKNVYSDAYELNLKGCTTYRPNAVTGAVLRSVDAGSDPTRDPAQDQSSPLAMRTATAESGAARTDARELSPASATQRDDVVYMSQPLEREAALSGFTYKLKWPESDHAIYVTINDIMDNGRRRPFEIFINTRNLEHYAWTVALTRMISAVFRRGGDVAFVAEELKAIFDPQGGRWLHGRYVPSLLAAIGDIIETHLTRTGFLSARDHLSALSGKVDRLPETAGQRAAGRTCPRCSSPDYIKQESCWICQRCGFSRCS